MKMEKSRRAPKQGDPSPRGSKEMGTLTLLTQGKHHVEEERLLSLVSQSLARQTKAKSTTRHTTPHSHSHHDDPPPTHALAAAIIPPNSPYFLP
jgi:hypothetical protein